MNRLYSVLIFAIPFMAIAAQTPHIQVASEVSDMSHREFVKQNHILPQKTLVAAKGAEEVIVTPPADAEIKMYTRSSDGYSVRWGQAYEMHDEGIVGEIAFCENGDVYVKNPVSFKPMDTWMKGKLDGTTLTFTFPQLIALLPADEGVEDGEVMEVWLNMLTASTSSQGITFVYDDAEPNEMTMTIDIDGNVTYIEPTSSVTVTGSTILVPDKMMGLTDSSNEWLGFGDYCNTYEPFMDKPTVIPTTLESKEYAMTYDQNGKWVKIAFDDNDSKVYISGIYTPDEYGFEGLADHAIVGDLLVGGAMFNSRQYMGVDPYYYHAYLSGGEVVTEGEEQYLNIQDQFFMTIDEKRSKLTSGSTLAVSEGEKQGYVLDLFYYPTFDAQEGYVEPSPAEPKVTGYMPYTPQYGYGGVKVQIPNTNRNGQLLHEENLSYSIIINDKNIIFDPEDYPEFDEATPWIPFNFSSYNVEIFPYEFNTRMVFMTEELMDVHTISVQSRYKYDNTYYVTNGPTYTYKQPQLAVPTFDPPSGYEFAGDEGQVTITAPAGAIVSYKVVSEGGDTQDYTDSDSNEVTVKVTENCFIQAFSKNPEADEETWSQVVTATYIIKNSSIESILVDSNDDVEIFTLEGIRVNSGKLAPGLYIVVKSGKATRIFVR